MPLLKPFAVWLCAALFSDAALAQTGSATRPDSARLPIIIDLPAGDGHFPAIVLAPGQSYRISQ